MYMRICAYTGICVFSLKGFASHVFPVPRWASSLARAGKASRAAIRLLCSSSLTHCQMQRDATRRNARCGEHRRCTSLELHPSQSLGLLWNLLVWQKGCLQS